MCSLSPNRRNLRKTESISLSKFPKSASYLANSLRLPVLAFDVEESSILGARNCDIYVGIFGTRYSFIVTKEYNQAIKKFKPAFIYAKKLEDRERDKKLCRFLYKTIH